MGREQFGKDHLWGPTECEDLEREVGVRCGKAMGPPAASPHNPPGFSFPMTMNNFVLFGGGTIIRFIYFFFNGGSGD